MRRSLILVSLCALFLVGCGAHEGVTTPADVAWIQFSGDTRGALASIDGAEAFLLRPEQYSKKDSSAPKHYQVNPGKHHIVVTRNGKIIVERIVLIGNQQIKEILVP
jgi:hypothetical protein